MKELPNRGLHYSSSPPGLQLKDNRSLGVGIHPSGKNVICCLCSNNSQLWWYQAMVP